MIISASYRTDIPAFYGRWFLNRLRAGYCRTINAFNGRPSDVALGPGSVDAFVFWTRNFEPLFPDLDLICGRAPFVVQFTVTGYPRALETSVVLPERAVGQIQQLSARFGPKVPVWRYDPIVVSSLTSPEWHLENFRRLAAELRGHVDEVVISFVQVYRKTLRNLDAAAARRHFEWRDPGEDEKRELVRRLVDIAADHGMTLAICSQPQFSGGGAHEARCIDAHRLSDVAGRPIGAIEKGNRPGCRCAQSRDIGAYDTCPHGCAYCYAVENRNLAVRRFRAHDPDSPFLFAPEKVLAAQELPKLI